MRNINRHSDQGLFKYRLNIPAALSCLAVVSMLSVVAPTSLWAANEETAKKPSDFGNYLAGRHAQYMQDSKAAISFYKRSLKSDPGNQDIKSRLLSILLSEGAMTEALILAQDLKKATGDQATLAQMVLLLRDTKAGKHDAVLERLEKFPNDGISSLSVPLFKSWALAATKKYDDALSTLSERISNPGMSVLLGPHAALINELAGRNDIAEKSFKDAIKNRRSAGLRLTQLLGRLYERMGRKADAEKVYRDYLVRRPQSILFEPALKRLKSNNAAKPKAISARDGMAEALFSLSRSVQRQSPFEAMIFSRLALYLKPDFGIVKLLIGDNLIADGRFEEAIMAYQPMVNDKTYNWAARLRLARANRFLDKTDEAVKILRKMADENKTRTDAVIQLGDTYRAKMRYREAADTFEEAKKRISKFEPHHWQLLFWSAASHERLKEWPAAEKDFLKALELRPNEPRVLNYLGYSWVEQGKNLARARKMIETAVRRMPQAGFIVDSLGWVLYRLGDLKGAVKNLERAVLLTPHDPTINDHLGDVYWKVNRKIEAHFQWNRALSLEPEKDQIPLIKKKLIEGLPKI